jgi:predicted TIM-barrel fold metal-dependent hydrolase
LAGIRAHNRWLVDFCSQTPGRRGGLAQVFLNDVDDAIAEVRYAKENGLMGVLLPADHILQLVNLYSPDLDPLWRTCAELDMPVHRHTGTFGEAESDGGPAAPWIGRLELDFHAIRTIAHVICAGVFERYPSLRFITTEIGASAGIPAFLNNLDQMYDRERSGKNSDTRITTAVAAMKKKPSEYFASNCFVGGPMDVCASYDAGTPNLMFGADIPHSEGMAPFTTKAIRLSLAGLPDEDIKDILSRNAVRAYGFDLPLLQKVADRVGPTMAEIKSPLALEEYPNYPVETRHPIFNVAA